MPSTEVRKTLKVMGVDLAELDATLMASTERRGA
jgi:hypothetical protein